MNSRRGILSDPCVCVRNITKDGAPLCVLSSLLRAGLSPHPPAPTTVPRARAKIALLSTVAR